MATLLQIPESVPEILKKQLAISVRSIQWSYAIFWSISATQPGVLVWGDGYYNGDIKTRKTIQAIELNAEQMGLERSEQLKELYESLSAGEVNPQTRRPSASLSPEDLSDAEWYYLVCMSFIFNIGEGLPGRTLAKEKPIWLCNVHFVDSKVFSRSLLAKSSSIQTVVCFPFLGGVVELGTTDLVREDPNLIQHVKSSYLEILPLTRSRNNSSVENTIHIKPFACAGIGQDILSTKLALVGQNELDMDSPKSSSNDLMESIPLASRVQSWQFMDDELSNCVYDSMDSSDCISQTLVNNEKVAKGTKGDHIVNDLQELNNTKLSSLELQSYDIHYQAIVSTLLQSSNQLILRPNHQNCHQESCFISWKKSEFVKFPKSRSGISQIVLKKALFEVPQMHISKMVDSTEDEDYKVRLLKPVAEEVAMNHALSERKRREKLNERFSILRSLVPSANKDDKVSILDTAIDYLKELETRVEELESAKSESTMKRKLPQDTKEGTSDNYGNKKKSGVKKPLLKKRKVCDILDEKGRDINTVALENNSAQNITVSVQSRDVLIEIKCTWRDRVVLEIVDALNKINLDSHSVQSSIKDGILFLTIKSKLKGSTVASVRIIKKTLEKLV